MGAGIGSGGVQQTGLLGRTGASGTQMAMGAAASATNTLTRSLTKQKNSNAKSTADGVGCEHEATSLFAENILSFLREKNAHLARNLGVV